MSLVEFFFNGNYREKILYKNNNISPKTSEPTKEEIIKREQERIDIGKINSAKHHLNLLTTNIMYKFVDYTKITEENFKNCYRKINTEEWVIDLMWDEYKEFLSKYVIK